MHAIIVEEYLKGATQYMYNIREQWFGNVRSDVFGRTCCRTGPHP